jgi:hypothetical protein
MTQGHTARIARPESIYLPKLGRLSANWQTEFIFRLSESEVDRSFSQRYCWRMQTSADDQARSQSRLFEGTGSKTDEILNGVRFWAFITWI